jgi:malonyl-CoA decarboxylase
VAGYLKATAQERQAIIVNKLLPLASTPDSKQLIAHDLTKSVGGIHAAIELRMDLQELPDSSSSKAVQLDECVQNWLSVAFCVDSLALQQITFDSSGSSLEIIARADTVHAVRSISALKKRLQKSRRCYALFHQALPNFPLAFIHVALTSDLANSMR